MSLYINIHIYLYIGGGIPVVEFDECIDALMLVAVHVCGELNHSPINKVVWCVGNMYLGRQVLV
jgi:hypothetical protein